MIINSIVPLLLFTGFLFGQDNIETEVTKHLSQSEAQKELIEIETKDGNIFLGTLLDETEDNYKIKITNSQANSITKQLDNVSNNLNIRINNAYLYYKSLKKIKKIIIPPFNNDLSNGYLNCPTLLPA